MDSSKIIRAKYSDSYLVTNWPIVYMPFSRMSPSFQEVIHVHFQKVLCVWQWLMQVEENIVPSLVDFPKVKFHVLHVVYKLLYLTENILEMKFLLAVDIYFVC